MVNCYRDNEKHNEDFEFLGIHRYFSIYELLSLELNLDISMPVICVENYKFEIRFDFVIYLFVVLKLNYQSNIDCIEQLLEKSVLIRDIYLQNENYDLLILAEYYQTQKNDSNRTMEFFIRLFQNGDPRV